MITSKEFLTSDGIRLGNKLMMYMAINGIALKNNTIAVFPNWEYWKFFKEPPMLLNLYPKNKITEPGFNFYTDFFNNQSDLIKSENVEIGWIWGQSELYWKENKKEILELMQFTPELISQVKEKYKECLSKDVLCISVRLGDFKGHNNYIQLDKDYYLNCLNNYFPDYKGNILILSDDIETCKQWFTGTNFYYAEPNNTHLIDKINYFNNAIEQLVLGSLCKDFILSPSTFSWVIAYLGNNPDKQVIRPKHCFRGSLAKEHDDNIHYPTEWIKSIY